MVKYIFLFILFIHSMIHLLGFFKAFNIFKIEQLKAPISKIFGILWIFTFIIFSISILLFILKKEVWCISGFFAVLLSQVLIIRFWRDAKAGTFANILILIAIILSYANFNFDRLIKQEIFELNSQTSKRNKLFINDLNELPPIIQKWLKNSIIEKNKNISRVFLLQKGKMRIKPNGKWMNFEAKQWFSLLDPSFIWYADVSVYPFLFLKARDKYFKSKGNMLIKLLSLIPIVDESGKEIDQGVMVRYLAESVWFPSFALSTYLKWKEIDDNKAKVVFEYKNNKVEGVYKFDKSGYPISFLSKRYYVRGKKSSLEDWYIEIDRKSFRKFQGIIIPTKAKVIWRLKNSDFFWLKLEIKDVKYIDTVK